MYLRGSSSFAVGSPKFIALTALILAFPPVFTSFSKVDGLKVSLALVMLYIVRGIITIVSSYREELRPFFRVGRIFHFAEIPMVLGAAYCGLRWIPGWIIWPYEQMLFASGPVIILLEGFASMAIILNLGQSLSDYLDDKSTATKMLVVMCCAIGYLTSGLIVYSLYYNSQINTVANASLVAAILTMLLVLTAASIIVEYGTITDPALMSLYITYNIWTIARSSRQLTFRPDAKTLYRYRNYLCYQCMEDIYWFVCSYMSQAIWNLVPSESFTSMVSSILNMFSIEIIGSLLFQMSVFVLATRQLPSYEKASEPSEEASSTWLDWFFDFFWPCFGKSLIILVYTYAWLMYGCQSALPFWIDPNVWRWANIWICLLVYTRHLMVPPEHELWLHED